MQFRCVLLDYNGSKPMQSPGGERFANDKSRTNKVPPCISGLE